MVDVLSKILARTFRETARGLIKTPVPIQNPPEVEGEDITESILATAIAPTGELPAPETPAVEGEIEQPPINLATLLDTAPTQIVEPRKPQPVIPEEQLQIAPPPMEETEQKPAFYELPKEIVEKGLDALGKGISKLPVLPDVLQFVSPVFEFIQEKLEKPFAAIITAPWSPGLEWKSGESWLDHEKREFEQWDAPTYVKGTAEFAMPLWWVPYLGWAAKGARSLGVGNKMAQTLAKQVQKAGKLLPDGLPSGRVLDDALFKKDFFKTASLWAENKPVISGVVRAIGGPAAFVRAPVAGEAPIQVVNRAVVKRMVITEMRSTAENIMLPRLVKYGDIRKLLQIDEAGLVGSVTPKKAFEKLGTGISEVFEQTEKYTFNSVDPAIRKLQAQYIKDFKSIVDEVQALARKEGVKVPDSFVYHRMVDGKHELLEGGKLGNFVESELGSRFGLTRTQESMVQGIAKGVVYNPDPLRSASATIRHYVRKIAEKRFDDEVGILGKTSLENFAIVYPTEAARIVELSAQRSAVEHTTRAIQSVITAKGTSIAGATLEKIRAGLPKIGERLDRALSIRPRDVDTIINNVSKELSRLAKMAPAEVKVKLGGFHRATGNFRMSEIDDAIRSVIKDTTKSTRMIEKIHKQAYKLNKDEWDTALRAINNDVKGLLKTTKDELGTLKSGRTQFVSAFRTGEFLGGKGLAPARAVSYFMGHPAFKQKFFDKEVANVIDKTLSQTGNLWLGRMSAVSGSSRMLVAALDFSAPFIQGLSVLGRNPVAWTKAVIKQFEFFVKPENLTRYMDDPLTRVIRAERISAGGSAQTFEFFEALAPIQRGAEAVATKFGVPIAGTGLKKVLGQTYGRAEVAFTGFGEVARNEMWKALRRKALRPDGTLDAVLSREVARTIDRMTGVMSTEALAIGLSQRQFENAFLFFAPRYTRASLGFVTDMLKGGITGAEARKSLGALAASGFAMYYGVTKALGQTPNLDPRSARFMTVEIAGKHVGIGGVTYSLMRLMSNVATTAVEEPLDLVRLNRFDNPFIKFMYSKSAPLTGLTIGLAVEHKNYFGEPFEDFGDYGKFLADKLIPISLQEGLPGQSQPFPVFVAEIAGMRTFPRSAWEERELARDKYSMDNYNIPYQNLPELQQNEIDEMPDIVALQEEADKRSLQIGNKLTVAFIERRKERDSARYQYVDTLNQSQRAFDAGVITGFDYREYSQFAGYGLGQTYDFIDTREQYKEAITTIKDPDELTDRYKGDIAYDEFNDALFSGRFEDEFGIFNFEALNAFREDFNEKWGAEVVDYVDKRTAQRRKDLPELSQELFIAREVLRPYWAIRDDVERELGKPTTKEQENKVDREVTRRRRLLRDTNPRVAKYFDLFYNRNPEEQVTAPATVGEAVNLSTIL